MPFLVAVKWESSLSLDFFLKKFFQSFCLFLNVQFCQTSTAHRLKLFIMGIRFTSLEGISVKTVHILLILECGGLLPVFKYSQRYFFEIICHFSVLGQELQFG